MKALQHWLAVREQLKPPQDAACSSAAWGAA